MTGRMACGRELVVPPLRPVDPLPNFWLRASSKVKRALEAEGLGTRLVVCSAAKRKTVTQKRKSAVLSIQWLPCIHMFLFSNCSRSKACSSVKPFADDEEDQTYIPEPESNRNHKYS